MSSTDTFLTSDRVRFNSGYHDGAAHQQRNGEGPSLHERNGVSDADHFDQVWLRGFHAGRQDVRLGHDTTLSDEAWRYYGPEACGMPSVFRSLDSKAPAPGHRRGSEYGKPVCECCLKVLA